MKAYELLLMVDPTLDETAYTAIVDKTHALITAEGGTIDETDDGGKCPLAYEIDHIAEAYYTRIDFHHDPFAIAEIDRVLRITDGLMRFMLVCRYDKE